ncbi:YjcB family protein [Candidatus Sodalis pierantonius]|uniref:YjcB family protein n=1 Tax=Candidatus Sodalis pierantonii TaxID=1486991 RepID=UPI003AA84845
MILVTYFCGAMQKNEGKLHHQLMIGEIFTVGMLAASFLVMRWELLSAMMMFFASQLHVQCHRCRFRRIRSAVPATSDQLFRYFPITHSSDIRSRVRSSSDSGLVYFSCAGYSLLFA